MAPVGDTEGKTRILPFRAVSFIWEIEMYTHTHTHKIHLADNGQNNWIKNEAFGSVIHVMGIQKMAGLANNCVFIICEACCSVNSPRQPVRQVLLMEGAKGSPG